MRSSATCSRSGDSIHKVTIIPRGRSLGSTWHLPEEEKFLGSKSEMLPNLASFMGGRVAEEIAIGDVTTGASNDIDRATKLAKQMVMQFGMSEKLGPQTFGEASHEVFLGRDFSANADYSPEVAYEIDKEVAQAHRRRLREGAQHPHREPRPARSHGLRARRAGDDRQERARGAAQQHVGRATSRPKRPTRTTTPTPTRTSIRPMPPRSQTSRSRLPSRRWLRVLRLHTTPDPPSWVRRRRRSP